MDFTIEEEKPLQKGNTKKIQDRKVARSHKLWCAGLGPLRYRARYHTVEQLLDRAEKYFETDDIWTFSGLAYFLGYANQQSLVDLQKKPLFRDAIQRIRLKIVTFMERRLFVRDGFYGARYWLSCQAGWVATEALDVTSDGKPIHPTPVHITFEVVKKEHPDESIDKMEVYTGTSSAH